MEFLLCFIVAAGIAFGAFKAAFGYWNDPGMAWPAALVGACFTSGAVGIAAFGVAEVIKDVALLI